MNKEFNYSFIIPHKNCPDLLQRCVDSIPERDDVQVIVVDDHSDEGKKPQINRPNMEVLWIDKANTSGPGRARNYGIEKARGKWILFADADDFYNKGFLEVLDKYKEEDLDAVYFDAESVDSKTLEPRPKRLRKLNEMIEKSLGDEESFLKLRCVFRACWAKMVRRDFIINNNICFEETKRGEDVIYSRKVGYLANKSVVVNEKLYVYTLSPNSYTKNKKEVSDYLSMICQMLKDKYYFKYIGHPEWKKISFFRFYLKYFRTKPVLGLKVLYKHYKARKQLKEEEKMFVY